MQSSKEIINNIMQINYAYDNAFKEQKIELAQNYEKLIFDYEHYLKPMTNKVIPYLFLKKKSGSDLKEIMKTIKAGFINDIKKELNRLELEEKNFDINLKKNLMHQVLFLQEEISFLNKKTENDKNKQKEKIEDFFNNKKAEFITLLKNNPELFLSLIREIKIIHLQFLFFLSFAEQIKTYLNSLKEEDYNKIMNVYFYYSPLDFKDYYNTNNLLSSDPYIDIKVVIAKINLRMIKHILSNEQYLKSKKLVKIYK